MDDRIAIVGAGLIGRAWAMIFARSGSQVALFDPVEGASEACLAACRTGLETLAAHGLCEDPAGAHARIRVARSLEAVVDGARHVQENGPERLEVKKDLFARLDAAAAPGAVLASSTSALRCSLFTEELAGRHRCLVAHPVNPPHLVPVVELSGAPWTSADVIAEARATYEAIGQAPITVLKEIDGFILNRLQAAVLTEAFRLVAEGYVTPHDLDTTMSEGLGRRWSFIGPFQTIELNAPGGLPDYFSRYRGTMGDLVPVAYDDDPWSEEASARIIEAWGPAPHPDEHARRTAERDRRLAALAAHHADEKKA
jgi:3-hydroxyacyl-CoA dehydrogenase